MKADSPPLIIELQQELRQEDADRLIKWAQEEMDRKVLILAPGMKVANLSEERLDRIERLLEKLTESLP